MIMALFCQRHIGTWVKQQGMWYLKWHDLVSISVGATSLFGRDSPVFEQRAVLETSATFQHNVHLIPFTPLSLVMVVG